MLRALYNKYKDLILYLFFGGLTTLVNYAVYIPLYRWSAIPEGVRGTVSNCIAWLAAVVFAYLTNKPFVFKSNNWSVKTVAPEFAKFSSCRLFSGLIETLIILLTVDCLGWNGYIMKILTSVFVIIINYFASKLLVFRKKDSE